MNLSKKDEARIAGIISSIGKATRDKIRTLPKEHQDLAWSTVAGAVATAAIHDAQDRDKVYGFIKDSVTGMMGLMEVHDADDDDIESAIDAMIKEAGNETH